MSKRNVVLTGFMGTGKSTVGRLLAARLGYEFVDTDELIAIRSGRSIPDIFSQDGEQAFRRWESHVSQTLAGRKGLVIATGGGLMLDSDNAVALGEGAHVFCLTAEPEEIVARLANTDGDRPLLDGPNPAMQIRKLLAQRADRYGRFPQVDTSGKNSQQIVEEIMQCISVM
jgi:shikimate kinase